MENNDYFDEIKNWKIDAKLEDTERYFYHIQVIDDILKGNKSYIIGRKGTGKTAVADYLVQTSEECIFKKKLSFKNFPFQELYSLQNKAYINPSQYITLWKYVIYTSIVKMFIENENIDLQFRNKLKVIYKNDMEKSLSRKIKIWTGGGFDLSVLGTGSGISSTFDERKNETNWIDKVDLLEDVIKEYIDKAKYIIIFDELDEDYKDMHIKEKYKDYDALLTSLFKSVQEIKSLFPNEQCSIFPVVCLREDIYDLLDDNDKNKWSDYEHNMEWNEISMKNLLGFRLSRAIDPDKNNSSFVDNWNIVFSDEDIFCEKRENKFSSFGYITQNTLLRPRDYIRYISICCDLTIKRSGSIILPDTIVEAEEIYSNYLCREFIDEIQGIMPDIKEILKLFSRIRKEVFSVKEFYHEYDNAIDKGYIKKSGKKEHILNILFHFSVIGNIINEEYYHGNKLERKDQYKIFKYIHRNAEFNFDKLIILHRGLLKTMQIF